MENSNSIQILYQTMPNHYVAHTHLEKKDECAVQELFEQPLYITQGSYVIWELLFVTSSPRMCTVSWVSNVNKTNKPKAIGNK